MVVTLGDARLEGKLEVLFLARVKLSLLNEEANLKVLVTEGDTNRGRCQNRSPQKRDKSGTRSKSRGRPTCFYCRKPGNFKKNCRHFRKDKGGADNVIPKKISEGRDISTFTTSGKKLRLINEESELHLVNDEIMLYAWLD